MLLKRESNASYRDIENCMKQSIITDFMRKEQYVSKTGT